jgi:hypothetical protein
MSGIRVSVENVIASLYQLCPILHRRFRIGSEPAAQIFLTAVLMYNIHVCTTRSAGSSSRFGVSAPLLHEYLHPITPEHPKQWQVLHEPQEVIADFAPATEDDF